MSGWSGGTTSAANSVRSPFTTSKHVRTPPWSVRESEDEETLKHTTTSMFSWWGASLSPAEDRRPARRTVKTRQAHIEVRARREGR